jgi:hypothetical protein
MRNNYEKASWILIWLGGDSDTQNHGLRFLSYLVDTRLSIWPGREFGKQHRALTLLAQDIVKASMGLAALESFETGWKGLRPVIQSP